MAGASRGGTATKPSKWRCDRMIAADGGWTCSLLSMQTIETEDVPAIDLLPLDAPEASLAVEESCGAGVYSPREAPRKAMVIPSTLNQPRPVARPGHGERDGPPQIRNIPPLDQTPLWTQERASRVASSSSSRSVVPTTGSWVASPRAPAPSSLTLAASTSRPLIPSWEVSVDDDDDVDMYVDVAMPVTRESQNPGRDPAPSREGVSGLQW